MELYEKIKADLKWLLPRLAIAGVLGWCLMRAAVYFHTGY